MPPESRVCFPLQDPRFAQDDTMSSQLVRVAVSAGGVGLLTKKFQFLVDLVQPFADKPQDELCRLRRLYGSVGASAKQGCQKHGYEGSGSFGCRING